MKTVTFGIKISTSVGEGTGRTGAGKTQITVFSPASCIRFKRYLGGFLAALLIFEGVAIPLAHAKELETIWSSRRSSATKLASIPPIASPSLSSSGIGLPASSLFAAGPKIHLQGGQIRETHQGWKKTAPTITIIQDVHLNSEAQANISKILGAIGSRVIAVEGAEGKFDFSALRAFPNTHLTNTLAKHFLDSSTIAASSYFGITSPRPHSILGIDDRTAYAANIAALKRAQPTSPNVLKRLSTMEKALDEKKQRLLAPASKELDDLFRSWEQQAIGLADYIETLEKWSGTREREFAVEQFLIACKWEHTLDLKAAEQERQHLIGTQEWDKNKFPNFARYLDYLALAERIDTERLFQATHHLERRALNRIAIDAPQKELFEQSRELYLLKKLASFSLVPVEWQEYKQRFLTINNQSLPELLPFEQFYMWADRRSQKMVEALQTVGEKNASIAVVVGGFHTWAITQGLKSRGISYSVIQPTLTKVETNEGTHYLSAFTREKSPLEKLVFGEKLFLAPPDTLVGSPGHQADATLLQMIVPLTLAATSPLPSTTHTTKFQMPQRTWRIQHRNFKPLVVATGSENPRGYVVIQSVTLPIIGTFRYLAKTAPLREASFPLLFVALKYTLPAFTGLALFAALSNAVVFAFMHREGNKRAQTFGAFLIIALAATLFDPSTSMVASAKFIGTTLAGHAAWNFATPSEWNLKLKDNPLKSTRLWALVIVSATLWGMLILKIPPHDFQPAPDSTAPFVHRDINDPRGRVTLPLRATPFTGQPIVDQAPTGILRWEQDQSLLAQKLWRLSAAQWKENARQAAQSQNKVTEVALPPVDEHDMPLMLVDRNGAALTNKDYAPTDIFILLRDGNKIDFEKAPFDPVRRQYITLNYAHKKNSDVWHDRSGRLVPPEGFWVLDNDPADSTWVYWREGSGQIHSLLPTGTSASPIHPTHFTDLFLGIDAIGAMRPSIETAQRFQQLTQRLISDQNNVAYVVDTTGRVVQTIDSMSRLPRPLRVARYQPGAAGTPVLTAFDPALHPEWPAHAVLTPEGNLVHFTISAPDDPVVRAQRNAAMSRADQIAGWSLQVSAHVRRKMDRGIVTGTWSAIFDSATGQQFTVAPIAGFRQNENGSLTPFSTLAALRDALTRANVPDQLPAEFSRAALRQNRFYVPDMGDEYRQLWLTWMRANSPRYREMGWFKNPEDRSNPIPSVWVLEADGTGNPARADDQALGLTANERRMLGQQIYIVKAGKTIVRPALALKFDPVRKQILAIDDPVELFNLLNSDIRFIVEGMPQPVAREEIPDNARVYGLMDAEGRFIKVGSEWKKIELLMNESIRLSKLSEPFPEALDISVAALEDINERPISGDDEIAPLKNQLEQEKEFLNANPAAAQARVDSLISNDTRNANRGLVRSWDQIAAEAAAERVAFEEIMARYLLRDYSKWRVVATPRPLTGELQQEWKAYLENLKVKIRSKRRELRAANPANQPRVQQELNFLLTTLRTDNERRSAMPINERPFFSNYVTRPIVKQTEKGTERSYQFRWMHIRETFQFMLLGTPADVRNASQRDRGELISVAARETISQQGGLVLINATGGVSFQTFANAVAYEQAVQAYRNYVKVLRDDVEHINRSLSAGRPQTARERSQRNLWLLQRNVKQAELNNSIADFSYRAGNNLVMIVAPANQTQLEADKIATERATDRRSEHLRLQTVRVWTEAARNQGLEAVAVATDVQGKNPRAIVDIAQIQKIQAQLEQRRFELRFAAENETDPIKKAALATQRVEAENHILREPNTVTTLHYFPGSESSKRSRTQEQFNRSHGPGQTGLRRYTLFDQNNTPAADVVTDEKESFFVTTVSKASSYDAARRLSYIERHVYASRIAPSANNGWGLLVMAYKDVMSQLDNDVPFATLSGPLERNLFHEARMTFNVLQNGNILRSQTRGSSKNGQSYSIDRSKLIVRASKENFAASGLTLADYAGDNVPVAQRRQIAAVFAQLNMLCDRVIEIQIEGGSVFRQIKDAAGTTHAIVEGVVENNTFVPLQIIVDQFERPEYLAIGAPTRSSAFDAVTGQRIGWSLLQTSWDDIVRLRRVRYLRVREDINQAFWVERSLTGEATQNQTALQGTDIARQRPQNISIPFHFSGSGLPADEEFTLETDASGTPRGLPAGVKLSDLSAKELEKWVKQLNYFEVTEFVTRSGTGETNRLIHRVRRLDKNRRESASFQNVVNYGFLLENQTGRTDPNGNWTPHQITMNGYRFDEKSIGRRRIPDFSKTFSISFFDYLSEPSFNWARLNLQPGALIVVRDMEGKISHRLRRANNNASGQVSYVDETTGTVYIADVLPKQFTHWSVGSIKIEHPNGRPILTATLTRESRFRKLRADGAVLSDRIDYMMGDNDALVERSRGVDVMLNGVRMMNLDIQQGSLTVFNTDSKREVVSGQMFDHGSTHPTLVDNVPNNQPTETWNILSEDFGANPFLPDRPSEAWKVVQYKRPNVARNDIGWLDAEGKTVVRRSWRQSDRNEPQAVTDIQISDTDRVNYLELEAPQTRRSLPFAFAPEKMDSSDFIYCHVESGENAAGTQAVINIELSGLIDGKAATVRYSTKPRDKKERPFWLPVSDHRLRIKNTQGRDVEAVTLTAKSAFAGKNFALAIPTSELRDQGFDLRSLTAVVDAQRTIATPSETLRITPLQRTGRAVVPAHERTSLEEQGPSFGSMKVVRSEKHQMGLIDPTLREQNTVNAELRGAHGRTLAYIISNDNGRFMVLMDESGTYPLGYTSLRLSPNGAWKIESDFEPYTVIRDANTITVYEKMPGIKPALNVIRTYRRDAFEPSKPSTIRFGDTVTVRTDTTLPAWWAPWAQRFANTPVVLSGDSVLNQLGSEDEMLQQSPVRLLRSDIDAAIARIDEDLLARVNETISDSVATAQHAAAKPTPTLGLFLMALRTAFCALPVVVLAMVVWNASVLLSKKLQRKISATDPKAIAGNVVVASGAVILFAVTLVGLLPLLSPLYSHVWSKKAKRWGSSIQGTKSTPIYDAALNAQAMQRYANKVQARKLYGADRSELSARTEEEWKEARSKVKFVEGHGDIEGPFVNRSIEIYTLVFAGIDQSEKQGTITADKAEALREELDAFIRALNKSVAREWGRGNPKAKYYDQKDPHKDDKYNPQVIAIMEKQLSLYVANLLAAIIKDREEKGSQAFIQTFEALQQTVIENFAEVQKNRAVEPVYNMPLLNETTENQRWNPVPEWMIVWGRHLLKLIPAVALILTVHGPAFALNNVPLKSATFALIAIGIALTVTINAVTESRYLLFAQSPPYAARLRALFPMLAWMGTTYLLAFSSMSVTAFLLLGAINIFCMFEALFLILPRTLGLGGYRSLWGVAFWYAVRPPAYRASARYDLLLIFSEVAFLAVAVFLGGVAMGTLSSPGWWMTHHAYGFTSRIAASGIRFLVMLIILNKAMDYLVRFVFTIVAPSSGLTSRTKEKDSDKQTAGSASEKKVSYSFVSIDALRSHIFGDAETVEMAALGLFRETSHYPAINTEVEHLAARVLQEPAFADLHEALNKLLERETDWKKSNDILVVLLSFLKNKSANPSSQQLLRQFMAQQCASNSMPQRLAARFFQLQNGTSEENAAEVFWTGFQGMLETQQIFWIAILNRLSSYETRRALTDVLRAAQQDTRLPDQDRRQLDRLLSRTDPEAMEALAKFLFLWLSPLWQAEARAGVTLFDLGQLNDDPSIPDASGLRVGQSLNPSEKAVVEHAWELRRALSETGGAIMLGGFSIDVGFNMCEIARSSAQRGTAHRLLFFLCDNMAPGKKFRDSETDQRIKLAQLLEYLSHTPKGHAEAYVFRSLTAVPTKSGTLNTPLLLPEVASQVDINVIVDVSSTVLDTDLFWDDIQRMWDHPELIGMVAQRNVEGREEAVLDSEFAAEGGHYQSMRAAPPITGTGWGNTLRVSFWSHLDALADDGLSELFLRYSENSNTSVYTRLFGQIGFSYQFPHISEDYAQMIGTLRDAVSQSLRGPSNGVTGRAAGPPAMGLSTAEWTRARSPFGNLGEIKSDKPRWVSGYFGVMGDGMLQQALEFGPHPYSVREVRAKEGDTWALLLFAMFYIITEPLSVIFDFSPFVGQSIYLFLAALLLNQAATLNSLRNNIDNMGFLPGFAKWISTRVSDLWIWSFRENRNALSAVTGLNIPNAVFEASGGVTSDNPWQTIWTSYPLSFFYNVVSYFRHKIAGHLFLKQNPGVQKTPHDMLIAQAKANFLAPHSFFDAWLVGVLLTVAMTGAALCLDAPSVAMMFLFLLYSVGGVFGPLIKARKRGATIDEDGWGEIMAKLLGFTLGAVALYAASILMRNAAFTGPIPFALSLVLISLAIIELEVIRQKALNSLKKTKHWRIERFASEMMRSFWTLFMMFFWMTLSSAQGDLRFPLLPGWEPIVFPVQSAMYGGLLAGALIGLVLLLGKLSGDNESRKISARYAKMHVRLMQSELRDNNHWQSQIRSLLTKVYVDKNRVAWRKANAGLDKIEKLLSAQLATTRSQTRASSANSIFLFAAGNTLPGKIVFAVIGSAMVVTAIHYIFKSKHTSKSKRGVRYVIPIALMTTIVTIVGWSGWKLIAPSALSHASKPFQQKNQIDVWISEMLPKNPAPAPLQQPWKEPEAAPIVAPTKPLRFVHPEPGPQLMENGDLELRQLLTHATPVSKLSPRIGHSVRQQYYRLKNGVIVIKEVHPDGHAIFLNGKNAVAYNPIETGKQPSDYSKDGSYADLYSPLLPTKLTLEQEEKYPLLKNVIRRRLVRDDRRPTNEAELLHGVYLRTYDVTGLLKNSKQLAEFKQMLRFLYEEHQILISIGIFNPHQLSNAEADQLAAAFREEPTWGFDLGNEINIAVGRESTHQPSEEMYNRVNRFAARLKRGAPATPTIMAFCNAISPLDEKAMRELLPNVDMIGINLFENSADAVAKRVRQLQQFIGDKPLVIAELGVQGSLPQQGIQARDPQSRRALYQQQLSAVTRNTENRLAPIPIVVTFEWVNEDWKNHDNGFGIRGSLLEPEFQEASEYERNHPLIPLDDNSSNNDPAKSVLPVLLLGLNAFGKKPNPRRRSSSRRKTTLETLSEQLERRRQAHLAVARSS